jgi:hypothetical protein
MYRALLSHGMTFETTRSLVHVAITTGALLAIALAPTAARVRFHALAAAALGLVAFVVQSAVVRWVHHVSITDAADAFEQHRRVLAIVIDFANVARAVSVLLALVGAVRIAHWAGRPLGALIPGFAAVMLGCGPALSAFQSMRVAAISPMISFELMSASATANLAVAVLVAWACRRSARAVRSPTPESDTGDAPNPDASARLVIAASTRHHRLAVVAGALAVLALAITRFTDRSVLARNALEIDMVCMLVAILLTIGPARLSAATSAAGGAWSLLADVFFGAAATFTLVPSALERRFHPDGEFPDVRPAIVAVRHAMRPIALICMVLGALFVSICLARASAPVARDIRARALSSTTLVASFAVLAIIAHALESSPTVSAMSATWASYIVGLAAFAQYLRLLGAASDRFGAD